MLSSKKQIAKVRTHFEGTQRTAVSLAEDDTLVAATTEAAQKIATAFKRRRTLFVAGNGGSAADAQHFAAELVGWYRKGSVPRRAIALTTDTSFLTAWGNDASFDEIFSRQLEALGAKGDVLFVMSTSGNSRNILAVLKTAKKMGIYSIALLGSGGAAQKMADAVLSVPSPYTPHIQEGHIAIIHAICECLSSPR